MQTKDYIAYLNSGKKNHVLKAIDYFDDLFYYDKAISDEDYFELVVVITNEIERDSDNEISLVLLGLLGSSFYSDREKGQISTITFRNALEYVTKNKSRVFRKILEPLRGNVQFDPILKPYFKEIDRNKS